MKGLHGSTFGLRLRDTGSASAHIHDVAHALDAILVSLDRYSTDEHMRHSTSERASRRAFRPLRSESERPPLESARRDTTIMAECVAEPLRRTPDILHAHEADTGRSGLGGLMIAASSVLGVYQALVGK